MLEFISSNVLLFIALGVILVFALLFFVIKYSKSKTSKVTKVYEKKSSDASSEEKTTETKQENPDDDKTEKPADENEDKKSEEEVEEKTDKEEIETKKGKEKPKKSVEKVYKRTVSETTEIEPEKQETGTSSISEEDLLSKMEFVRTSKKVSKLVNISKKGPLAEDLETMVIDEPYLPPPGDASEEAKKLRKHYHLKEHRKHFDKSKRLSKFVEEGNFDEMFDSHISDGYLDIDVSRHLETGDDYLTRLFDRASKTLAGGSIRVIPDDDQERINIKTNKNAEKSYIENKKKDYFAQIVGANNDEEFISDDMKLGEIDIDENIKLDSKTILVADAVLKRKGKGGKK